MIYNFNDFVASLLAAGFSMGGSNSEGVHAIIPWNWNEEPPYDTPVRWHTGDLETDPWEWRMRVLEERDDIAYAKLFFKKSGFITREWYPYFLAARRGNKSFCEAYAAGTISHAAKRIYDVVQAHHVLPMPAIKAIAGFGREDKSLFDRALTELQMKMYLTICDIYYKISQTGEEYGFSSTVFCTTELFWGEDMLNKTANISEKEAIEAITERILSLNESARREKIIKFIKG